MYVENRQIAISSSRVLCMYPTQQVPKVLKLGYTNLIFTEHGAIINRQYNWEVLPMQELLLLICSIAVYVFVFQHDNALITLCS